MARIIQPLRRTILPNIQNLLKYLQIQKPISPISHFHFPRSPINPPQNYSTLSIATELRKSAIDDNLLRRLRSEIDYELDHSPVPKPAAEFNGFKVEERPGEQWISLEKKFGEAEEIKLEVTMFDGSASAPKGERKGLPGEEVYMHITMIVSIFKEESNQVLEFICSAWPESVEIKKLFVRERAKIPRKPYTGPPVRQLDDALQDSLYDFLAERGIDDSLCEFLHKYVDYKDKAEYMRWMRYVKTALEK